MRTRSFLTERVLFPLHDVVNVYPNESIDSSSDYVLADFYTNFSKSEMLLYFKGLQVDVPCVLASIASYRRTASTTRLSRFNNYFHRGGKKLKFMLVLLKAYDQVFNAVYPLTNSVRQVCHWREVHGALHFYTNGFSPQEQVTSFGSTWDRSRFLPAETPSLDKFLFKNLLKLDLLFSFYVYKVDKHLYKNSRGKSGKFTFVWKYVPPYKRFNLISCWFMRELKVTPGKTLHDRVVGMLHLFVTNFRKSWLWKVKKFSSIFVYSKLRTSLARDYKVSRRS